MVKALGGWPYVVAALGLTVALCSGAVAAVTASYVGSVAPAAFWTAAVGASVFYGFASLAVWRQPDRGADDTGLPVWPLRVHKWWFNGLGSFAGWCALYALPGQWQQHGASVGVSVLGLVGLLGVCGWLPATAVGLVQAVGKLAEKATDALTPK